ncbi:PREDICTED: F-box protein SKIP1-like isoform X3 [Camelina sativa]|uniref:F-box protein SKIP1-like isoform X3 n=1 Tax=Camelina sativa TaxID=90675 RepID=A0ABM1R9Q2_CAMSA|nr:PREDICTED: F-box protein SKIP1-like isoform X3 [Camelina sativa]
MEEDRSESDWGGLAPDILMNIISRLTVQELWTGPMFVRKSWLTVCRDSYLWSIFDLEPWFESYPQSAHLWSPDFERKVDLMLRSVVDWSDGGLTEIRVRHCSDYALSYATDRCPNLQVLAIRSSPNVTDASMTKIAFRCRSLKEIDISYCHEISHDTLVMIGRNCPNLRILKRNLMDWSDSSRRSGFVPTEYVDACPQDGDTEADAIGKHMIYLERLEIQFSRLSVKGLASICEGCPKLEYLDLSGCVHLSSRDIANNVSRIKRLKEVKKPDVYVPRSGDVAQTERYGHWRLYDERFDIQAMSSLV